jgi:ABC-2 type transport system ATP-binding protein
VHDATPAVVVDALTVTFGKVDAVSELSLVVPRSDSLALIGRNGAGKSTTLRVLAGVAPPNAGRVEVCGIDVVKRPEDAKATVGYCPDVGGLIPRATPWEHLQLAASLRGLQGWEARGRLLLDRFDLSAAADRITAGFSHGMGRRLSVALAAFHEPEVLLLDEPFDGVDPLGVDATLTTIAELRASGAAVLVSTHLLDLAVRACDEAIVLSAGRAVGAFPTSSLAGADGAERYRSLLNSAATP